MRNSGEGKKLSRDVARHELIGLEVEVLSAHAGWNGLKGRIVDETKHTFVVERAPRGSEAVIPKPGNRFVFLVGTERVIVQGDEITFQPEDRIKKIRG